MDGMPVNCGQCGAGVVVRGRPNIKWDRLTKCQETIVDLHRDGYSASWIAKLFVVSPTLMLNFLKDSGETPRSTGGPRGAKHWAWKGGRAVRKDGYISVAINSDDPYFDMHEGTRNYVFEHRYVMAQQLGRSLRSDETVHHKNGNKSDNRPENLQLMIGTHHTGVVACCADCGSQNITYARIGT